jgi:hypothetical protein
VSRRRGIGCVALALFAILALPASALASGQVFFGGWYDNAIGSVSFDGTDPQPNLVVDGSTIPEGLAVSGGYLYWESNSSGVRIGRSRIDGTEVNTHFLETNGGPAGAGGVSISNGRVYWIETRNSTGFGPTYLSAANLDGSDPQVRFLSLGTNLEGPTLVIGSWVFFVTHRDVRGVEHRSIARGRLDGKGSRRIVAANRPFEGGTLAGRGGHVYWLEAEDRRLFIARASIDAANIQTHWRRVPRRGCHMNEGADGIAVSSRFLFIGCPGGDVDRVAIKGPTRLKSLATGAKLSSGPVLAATP